jgi:hypothetical protein
MADNVQLPATGTGTADPVVATDDVSGVHYQKIKLYGGASDAAVRLDVSEDQASGDGQTGIPAMVVRKDEPAATSGTDGDYEMLQMANGKLWVAPLGFPKTISVDITRPADTTAYAVNDALSNSTSAPTSGGFTFTGAARKSGGSCLITDLIVTSSNDPATPIQGELFIFNTSVTNINDNAAFAVSDSEIKTCIAILATCSGSADLRFLVRVKNAYTPANAEVLTFIIKVLQID